MDTDELTLDSLEDQTASTQDAGGSVSDQSGTPQPSDASQITITPYTDDEVKHLLESDGKLDSNKLTPSQKLIQRSFEKYYQKRYQEGARQTRQVDQRATAPPTIEEMYDQNPDGTMDQIDMAIIQAKREDPFSEKVIQLEAVQKKLLRRDLRKQSEESTATRNISFAQEAIRKDIPDFDSKREKLNEFAEKELGIQGEELSLLTDPNVMGSLAIKLTKAVNTIFDRFNVLSQADKKEVKPKPPQLERAGASEMDKSTKDPLKMSYPEYKKWREANP